MQIKEHPLYLKAKGIFQSVRNKLLSDEDLQLQRNRSNIYRTIIKWCWRLVLAGLVFLVGLIIFITNQDLPTFEELENPKSSLATEVYFGSGELMGRYYIENRVNVDYADLNPYLVDCLIATEDERYFTHAGIDARALFRVAVKTILFQDQSAGGGSTITQQLAKLLYSNRDLRGLNKIQRAFKLVTIKLKEWVTAVKLEKAYTKEEIMAMYLNKFDFINDSHGIKAAAETYFGKDQSELSLEESATLIGMLKNSSLYNPNRFPERTKARREVVLSQVHKHEHITRAVYDSLRNLPLDMSNFKRSEASIGPAPYFRSELRKPILQILNHEDHRKLDGSKYNIYKDGLRIYTTIDSRMQAHLEKAVLEHMPVVQDKFWRTWKNKDPWTFVEYEDGERVTTPEALNVRKLTLERLITESDRYINMKTAMIGEELEALEDAVPDLRITDRVLDRFYREVTKGGVITTLLSVGSIDSDRAAQYRKAIQSEAWNQLQPEYEKLKSEAERVFNEPTKMRVFAYNEKMEKDTVMTPLDSLKYHRMFLQIGSMAVDPVTGHVKAWVGGINHKYFKFDHVRTHRLVGSTFKPFIYATAISQQGLSPCFAAYDQQQTIHAQEPPFYLPEDWSPKNIDNNYTGELYTLLEALRLSKNSISVYLMKQLGNVEQVRSLLRSMGIDVDEELSNGATKVPRVPAICLGAANLSVMEMAGAYTTFANNGMYNQPIFINRIEDRNGRVIYEGLSNEQYALNPVPNYTMVRMLDYALNENAPDFKGLKSEMGGKTGTTNDYTDGWFMGINPNVVVGTWVGGDDPWIRFLTSANGTGSRMARPVFAKFMHSVEQDSILNFDIDAKFIVPAGAGSIELDCTQYDYSELDEQQDPESAGDESFFEDPFGDDPFDTSIKPDTTGVKRDTSQQGGNRN
ncbi:MAG: transglycosylase domain-containing protein [Bacteroidia bacterium]|nr:transglycosylase domain-containing protein [Bacteroidia bacterium]